MEKLMKMFEDVMVAVTFAEAGEVDKAIKIGQESTEQDTMPVAVAPSKS